MAVIGTGLPARHRLARLPTPLHEAPRLRTALGVAGTLLVKRDDLTGFVTAGNKARPLEVLLADAERVGADVLVTGGAPSSNFCAAAVAAARHGGLDCVLVFAGAAPEGPSHPNHSAAVRWGATVRWTGSSDRASVDTALDQVAGELRARGRRPYAVPRGGANALGATGFHAAAGELAGQLPSAPDGEVSIVLAAGSGGSAAGLLAGLRLLARPATVLTAAVSRPPEETRDRIIRLASECASLVGDGPPPHEALTVLDARGPGHGLESTGGRRAAEIALETDGLVLDPVYTAKALAALPDLLGDSRHDPSATTVFWHTGGLLDAVAGWQS